MSEAVTDIKQAMYSIKHLGGLTHRLTMDRVSANHYNPSDRKRLHYHQAQAFYRGLSVYYRLDQAVQEAMDNWT